MLLQQSTYKRFHSLSSTLESKWMNKAERRRFVLWGERMIVPPIDAHGTVYQRIIICNKDRTTEKKKITMVRTLQ